MNLTSPNVDGVRNGSCWSSRSPGLRQCSPANATMPRPSPSRGNGCWSTWRSLLSIEGDADDNTTYEASPSGPDVDTVQPGWRSYPTRTDPRRPRADVSPLSGTLPRHPP